MSLLWRRAAITGFVLSGLIAVCWAVFTDAAPTAFAQIGCGAALTLGVLLVFDGRLLSHAALFSLIALACTTSIVLEAGVVMSALSIGACTTGIGSAAIAWLIREKDPEPSLSDYYTAAVRARRIRDNAAQQDIVATLDGLRRDFRRYERRRRMPWAFLLSAPPGIYLHGSAGQGKSFLLDGMFDTLPSRAKHRFHFHDLVANLSDELNRSGDVPFKRVARQLANRASLVLIDEVNVLDPATAVLFMRLMHAWWRMGCVVCISSNQSPHQLFKGVVVPPDQLGRFFEGLERCTSVHKLEAGEDYRLQKLSAADLYQHPIGERTDVRLQAIVELLAETGLTSDPYIINSRAIACRAQAVGIIWFEFDALCRAPLSYRDYRDLVATFPNLIVSNVPQLTEEDPARRFAWLVEIFYDKRKRLILSAHAPVAELFTPGLSSSGKDVDFVKIQSRLVEMQSSEYEYTLV